MIYKLPESLSSRIAAGEVVERPASVVKELVENALDAGASRIDVRLLQGGKISLVVEDDGGGIPFEELPLAVERYATSKLATLEDLYAIRTLGYRGEALASIALVSRMEIRSCPPGEEGGMIRMEEGICTAHERMSRPQGTFIQVEDLFCSIPARKKFLKSGAAETRRISRLLREYALAYPHVAFMLFSEGKPLFSSFGDGNRRELLAHLWGDSRIEECREEVEGYAVEAYHLSQEHVEKGHLVSFVNGRRCEDALFFSAVKAGSPRPGGEWLFLLRVPEEEVDVNVHPAKIEVRFRMPRQVFRVLHRAAQRLGGDGDPLKSLSKGESFSRDHRRGEPEAFSFPWEKAPLRSFPSSSGEEGTLFVPGKPQVSSSSHSFSFDSSPFHRAASPGAFSKKTEISENAAPEGLLGASSEEAREIPRYLGRLASGYLLFDRRGDLVIMDPHAAHERVEYERLTAMHARQRLPQKLLVPPGLPPSLGERALEQAERLEKLGFLLEEHQEGPILSGIPESFGGLGFSPLEGLRMALEVLEDMEEEDPEHLWKAWAFKACHRAVKLTDSLEVSEALELWRRLFLCSHPGSCPHGRPTLLCYVADFLEKEFHRR
jgi:DNA mismatch repair protein MutL